MISKLTVCLQSRRVGTVSLPILVLVAILVCSAPRFGQSAVPTDRATENATDRSIARALTATTRDSLFTVQGEELICFAHDPRGGFREIARLPAFPQSTAAGAVDAAGAVPQRLRRAGAFLFLEMSDGSVLVHEIADPARPRFMGRMLPRFPARPVLDPIGETEIGVSGYALQLSFAATGAYPARPEVIAPLSVPALLDGMSDAGRSNRSRDSSGAGASTGWTGLSRAEAGPVMIAFALGAEGSWYPAGDTTIAWPENGERSRISDRGSGAYNREGDVERAREGPSSTAGIADHNTSDQPAPDIVGSRLVAYHSATGRMVR